MHKMSANGTAKPTDLRVRRTRKHLIEALYGLMQEKPFQQISVQDITERAMVNRSTFYAHFVDKYDLFAQAIRQRIQADLAAGLGDAAHFTERNLRTLIAITGGIMLKISDDCLPTPVDDLLPLIMTQMQNSIYAVTLTWAHNLPPTGENAPPPEALAMVSAGTVFGSVNLWAQETRGLSIEQLADQIMPFLLDGIGMFVTDQTA